MSYSGERWEILLNKLPQLDIKAVLNYDGILPQQNHCSEIRNSIELSKRFFKALHIVVRKLGFAIVNPKLLSVRVLEHPFWEQSDLEAPVRVFLALAESCVYTGFVQLPVQMFNQLLAEFYGERIPNSVIQNLQNMLLQPLVNQVFSNAWTIDQGKPVYATNALLTGLPELPPDLNIPPFQQTPPLPRYGNRILPCCYHGLITALKPNHVECRLLSTKPCNFKILSEPEVSF